MREMFSCDLETENQLSAPLPAFAELSMVDRWFHEEHSQVGRVLVLYDGGLLDPNSLSSQFAKIFTHHTPPERRNIPHSFLPSELGGSRSRVEQERPCSCKLLSFLCTSIPSPLSQSFSSFVLDFFGTSEARVCFLQSGVFSPRERF
jgi:hypothetical protein